MSFPGNRLRRVLRCALPLLATSLALAARAAESAHTLSKQDKGRIVFLHAPIDPAERSSYFDADGEILLDVPVAQHTSAEHTSTQVAHSEPLPDIAPADAALPSAVGPENASSQIDVPRNAIEVAPGEMGPVEFEPYEIAPNNFTWQVGPSGIIYRSYLAGPLEPRISITPFYSESHSYWDATVGGRGGVLRYGDCDPLHPQGWQLDVYGAAIVRMDSENHQDLVSSDYVFGFPLTYGVENWQFKFGYAHISSHLGDEYAIRYPDALDDRVNYVRDGIVLGSSWYPVPACRVYGEFDWAFHVSDGAKPIAFQFGNELSHPGPTGLHGSPFFAINGRMREEHNFGGDVTVQSGWLWRGVTGKVFRLGGHFYNGKSSQAQFYRNSEEQIGIGLWYDF